MFEDFFKMDDQTSERMKILFAALVVAWLGALSFGIGWHLCGKDMDILADMGSWFGLLSCLFSAVALLGAVYAVILQSHELRATLEEHRQSKDAHKDNADSQRQMVELQTVSTLVQIGTKERATLAARLGTAYDIQKTLAQDLEGGRRDMSPTSLKGWASQYSGSIKDWIEEFGLEHPNLLKDATTCYYQQEAKVYVDKQIERLHPRFTKITADLERWTSRLDRLFDQIPKT